MTIQIKYSKHHVLFMFHPVKNQEMSQLSGVLRIVIKLYIKFKIAHSDMFYECWVAEQVKFGEHFIRSTYGQYDAVMLTYILYKFYHQNKMR